MCESYGTNRRKCVKELHTHPTTDDLKCQDGVMLDSGASACVCGMDWLQNRMAGKILLTSSRKISKFGERRGAPSSGFANISMDSIVYRCAAGASKIATDVIPGLRWC